jgi:DNA gyrase/topoisomerase IV subunit B
MAAKEKGSYTAADIDVLEGLEPVRQRPAMYIGGTGKAGYHHLLWEIVDNSIDEVINKHATRVDVTLHKDGKTVTVEDNGRGIPTDIHPKHKKSAVELVFTVLHAGGKFDRGKNYAVSAVCTAWAPRSSMRCRGDGRHGEARASARDDFGRGEPNPFGGARGTGRR